MLAGNAFDNGDKLHVLRPEFIAEIAIDVKAVVFVSSVDCAQDVSVDIGVTQVFPPTNHHRVSSMPATVETVGIMEVFRAIDGDADEKIVLFEEMRPLLGNQGAVGLDGMTNLLGGATILFAQLNEAFKEREAAQSRFAALPEHGDISIGAG